MKSKYRIIERKSGFFIQFKTELFGEWKAYTQYVKVRGSELLQYRYVCYPSLEIASLCLKRKLTSDDQIYFEIVVDINNEYITHRYYFNKTYYSTYSRAYREVVKRKEAKAAEQKILSVYECRDNRPSAFSLYLHTVPILSKVLQCGNIIAVVYFITTAINSDFGRPIFGLLFWTIVFSNFFYHIGLFVDSKKLNKN